MFKFEKLDVWHKAIDLSDEVYRVTRTFPSDERFGLTSQLRRAAVSVAANIAEGSGRGSARFVEIAFGSLMETISHLSVARRQEMIDQKTFDDIYVIADQLGRMLSGLRNSLRSDRQP